ncbi:nitroreductase family protein [Pectobacterium carotovorum]|uniref:nitroreductase family protein n=1 Tax=Pectobacterium carotovorum TaxID=554 RepID=UPI003017991A
MNEQDNSQLWADFQTANRERRAIREFDSTSVSDDLIKALLTEATFAPSSGNLQPYQFHWVKNAELKSQVALACNGQKAARSAAALIIVVASPDIGRHTAEKQLAYVEASASLQPKSKDYYRKQIGKFERILKLGAYACWTPLLNIASIFQPALSLLPVGHMGSRHWAARNSIFAAQTLMLGAAAKGLDSCPMEGFSATKLSQLLGLKRGTVIPVVIALGYRAIDARAEEQWRRPLADIVIEH